MMTDADKPIPISDEEHRIITAIDDVKATLTGRNPSYKIPPASYVDIEILIAQMVLKAERARQAVDAERQIDEVRDTAGYAILILGRLLDTTTQPEVSEHDVDLVLHDRKLQKHLDRVPAGSEYSTLPSYSHRKGKTDAEFSMFSDGYRNGYNQVLRDIFDRGDNRVVADINYCSGYNAALDANNLPREGNVLKKRDDSMTQDLGL